MKIEGSGSIGLRHGSADPDPHQNVMDPEHCFVCSGYHFFCIRTKVSLLIKMCSGFLRRGVVPIPNNQDSESCYSIWYTFFYRRLVILKICLSCLIVHICHQDCFRTVTVGFTLLN
jgi:hypothetical protein